MELPIDDDPISQNNLDMLDNLLDESLLDIPPEYQKIFSEKYEICKDLYSIWKAYKTIREMMEDRKYIKSDKLFDNVSFINFVNEVINEKNTNSHGSSSKSSFNISTLNSTFCKEDEKDKIFVMWFPYEKIGNNEIGIIYDILENENLKKCIIIARYSNNITSQAKKTIKSLKAKKFILEFFTEKELQANPKCSNLVYRHIECGAKKKKEVLTQYNITKSQAPTIKLTDKMCRYYGFQKGKLIKIVRVSDCMPNFFDKNEKLISLNDVTYRIVS